MAKERKAYSDLMAELVEVYRARSLDAEHGDAGVDYARLGWPEFWAKFDEAVDAYERENGLDSTAARVVDYTGDEPVPSDGFTGVDKPEGAKRVGMEDNDQDNIDNR